MIFPGGRPAPRTPLAKASGRRGGAAPPDPPVPSCTRVTDSFFNEHATYNFFQDFQESYVNISGILVHESTGGFGGAAPPRRPEALARGSGGGAGAPPDKKFWEIC